MNEYVFEDFEETEDDSAYCLACATDHSEETARLHKRIETLEAEIEIGARHFNQVSALLDMERKENEALRARVAELEAAQQWHPASKPPEMAGYYLVIVVTDTSRYIDKGQFVSHSYPYFSVGIGCDYDIDGWRDLPPMPEAKP